ncbi:MAG: DinB family protein [Balneolaceae bacterium]|jgi:hypothetical protein
MRAQKSVKELLLEQLKGRNAHIDFGSAVEHLTPEDAGANVDKIPHTIWDLIEHIRLAQEDILDFCKNPDYEELDWPNDYWPKVSKPSSKKELEDGIQAVKKGIKEMRDLIRDKEEDLLTPIAHGSGQTLFREALLIVDHNAYHIGQIVQLRRLLDCWK